MFATCGALSIFGYFWSYFLVSESLTVEHMSENDAEGKQSHSASMEEMKDNDETGRQQLLKSAAVDV